jgi:hypothetical protein
MTFACLAQAGSQLVQPKSQEITPLILGHTGCDAQPLDLHAQLGQNTHVTKDEALKQLADAEVVPCVSAGIADAKEILDTCLAADIPAILDRQDSCHGHGHADAIRIDLCVRPEDLPKVMAMMHERWQSLLDQEGTLPSQTAPSAECDEPPCPACGTAAPLQDGACTGCGLQLE